MTERGDFATEDCGYAVPKAMPPIFNLDEFVKGQKGAKIVIPAKAGIQ